MLSATDPSRKVILVTGANSGVGFGTAQRLLQHYSTTDEPITLVLACRNKSRALQAKAKLIAEYFLENPAEGDSTIEILLIDLGSSESVFKACAEFRRRFRRLDTLILNAGILPIDRLDYLAGLIETLTQPRVLARTGGENVLIQTRGRVNADGLGEVFAANVFGHYIMVKELRDSLSESKDGRIIWYSSTTADPKHFDESDYQCIKGAHPYESSKRLCELLCMATQQDLCTHNIHSFVCSPGNSATNMFGDGWIIQAILFTVLWFMRLCGMSGINISATNAATAATYITTVEDPQGLDPRKIYHSEISRSGKTSVALLPLPQDEEQAGRVLKQVEGLYREFRDKYDISR
ncbi:hypothetical protein HK097_009107 [Rhizophlyctis rosea]|uniref:NAD(P)-binding protein n=1 Tax=Rhizophlyctis rosea TaxID=64517 RepID=A0AAD5X3H4_9FUNG|nr:hypothetical protein HK097_009107 [Rhizophlyctis rosea]